jgi:hypothetical protein
METQESYITNLTADVLRIVCRTLSDTIRDAATSYQKQLQVHAEYPVGLACPLNEGMLARQRQIMLLHAGYLVNCRHYCDAIGLVYREDDFAVLGVKTEGEKTDDTL